MKKIICVAFIFTQLLYADPADVIAALGSGKGQTKLKNFQQAYKPDFDADAINSFLSLMLKGFNFDATVDEQIIDILLKSGKIDKKRDFIWWAINLGTSAMPNLRKFFTTEQGGTYLISLLKKLLNYGIDPNIPNLVTGEVPLNNALGLYSQKTLFDVLELLLKSGAHVSKTRPTWLFDLVYVIQNKPDFDPQQGIIEFSKLLSYSPNIGFSEKKNQTLLDYIVSQYMEDLSTNEYKEFLRNIYTILLKHNAPLTMPIDTLPVVLKKIYDTTHKQQLVKDVTLDLTHLHNVLSGLKQLVI